MSDQQIYDEAIEAHQSGYPITDGQARVIAAGWHGGQASAMYRFVSTGSIHGDLVDEIRRDMGLNVPELEALLAYVERVGERGPVADWSDTWG